MRPFKFRLETLLKVYRDKENGARQELAEAESLLNGVQQRIDALKAQGSQAEEEMRGQKQRIFTAPELAASIHYIDSLRTQVAGMQDDLFRAKNVVESKRQALAQAVQKRKSIEKLKEKRYAEWEAELQRLERQFADEQATLRHLHKR